MARKRNSFENFLKFMFGENPIIFLDTCTIINIMKRKHNKDDSGDVIVEDLPKIYPVLVTDKIYEEIEDHHQNHFRWGRKEISDCLFNKAKLFNDDFKYYKERMKFKEKFDDVKYLAYFIKEEVSYKYIKFGKGKVSDADYDLLTHLLFFSNGLLDGKEVSRCVVISKDGHISECVKLANECGYDNVLSLKPADICNNKK